MKKANHDNVFREGNKLFTVNQVPGRHVYGEALVKDGGKELRRWDLTRSKLGASIAKGLKIPRLKRDALWLYIGAATGTTVSHVSDIVDDGMVFAIEPFYRPLRELHFLSEERMNISPIMADAKHPESYSMFLPRVDVLFQDISQRDQVQIFLRNTLFLKKGGLAILSCKSRSIDIKRKPRDIFRQVEKELKSKMELIHFKTLEPFEKDHAVFLCKKL